MLLMGLDLSLSIFSEGIPISNGDFTCSPQHENSNKAFIRNNFKYESILVTSSFKLIYFFALILTERKYVIGKIGFKSERFLRARFGGCCEEWR